jgi:hypothetical protein
VEKYAKVAAEWIQTHQVALDYWKMPVLVTAALVLFAMLIKAV